MRNLKNVNFKRNEQHPFHLVDSSPWPIITSVSLYSLVLSFIMYFHYFKAGLPQLVCSLFLVILSLFRWFYDIVAEATYEGQHTFKVQQNVLLGMALFIISEIMFFFAFFWAFFHFLLSPSIWIGGVWPPTVEAEYLIVFWSTTLPLWNLVLLIGSGKLVDDARKCMREGKRAGSIFLISATIACGLVFSWVQKYEYSHASFSMNDGAYGSAFYSLTGFHGLHVLIGTIFLIVCLIRHLHYHFFKNHHTGFRCGVWYWHFVDGVWVVLYCAVYVWSNKSFSFKGWLVDSFLEVKDFWRITLKLVFSGWDDMKYLKLLTDWLGLSPSTVQKIGCGGSSLLVLLLLFVLYYYICIKWWNKKS